MDNPDEADHVKYAEVYIEYHTPGNEPSTGAVTSGDVDVTSGEMSVTSANGVVSREVVDVAAPEVIKVEDEPELMVLQPRQMPEFMPTHFSASDVHMMEFEEPCVTPMTVLSGDPVLESSSDDNIRTHDDIITTHDDGIMPHDDVMSEEQVREVTVSSGGNHEILTDQDSGVEAGTMSVRSPPLSPPSDIVTGPPEGEMFNSAARMTEEECQSPHAGLFEGDDTPLNAPVKEIKDKWKLLPAFLQVRI